MFPKRIVDVKNDDGEIVKDNSTFRKRMIIMLDIPTYKKFTEVMFFDVLQQICNKKVEIHHNAERIKENKQKLKIIKLFSQSPNVYDDTLQALEIPNIKTDYDIDYEKLIEKMTTANSKIQLIQALNEKTKFLNAKYNNQVDTTSNMANSMHGSAAENDEEVTVYTTKHWIYGQLI